LPLWMARMPDWRREIMPFLSQTARRSSVERLP